MDILVDQESYTHHQRDQDDHSLKMKTSIPQITGEQRVVELPQRSEPRKLENISNNQVPVQTRESAYVTKRSLPKRSRNITYSDYLPRPFARRPDLGDYEPWEVGIQQMNPEDIETRKKLEKSRTPRSSYASQEACLDALKNQTENLLRIPLNPSTSGPVSSDGFPLGVEAAKNAYDQGLLSTATVHRDCLPPALLFPKIASSLGTATDSASLSPSDRISFESGTSPLSPQQQAETDGPSLLVKRRNPSEQQQLKRLNQAPLSAIYEESTSPRCECTCGLCSGTTNGRGIVWFHLCPRYTAMAREKGIKYEPYEGRIILHHAPGKESVGLIIEGPMEDRLVPAGVMQPVIEEIDASGQVKIPRPPKLDLRSMHSASSRSNRPVTRTTSFNVLPLIAGPNLKQPISPAQVFQLSSSDALSSEHCAKEGASDGAPTAMQNSNKRAERRPTVALSPSQRSVHPALREGGVETQKWSRAPTRSQSVASIQENVQQRPRSAISESAERPTRVDSLGAPTDPGLVELSDRYLIDQRLTTGRAPQQELARQWTKTVSSSCVVSPSAGHQRMPSVFLAPSTPSTASFQRSSTSSYGEIQQPLAHDHQSKETELIGKVLERQSTDPFRSLEDSIANTDYDKNEPNFTPESYHTAPGSHNEQSPSVTLPQTAHANQTSTSCYSNNSRRRNSPFPQAYGYLQSQASKHSSAQSFTNLNQQRDIDVPTSPSLLNGNPFTTVDRRTPERTRGSVYDEQYTFLDPPRTSTIHSHDPMLTAGSAKAHSSKNLTPTQAHNKRASTHSKLAIPNSPDTASSNPRHKRHASDDNAGLGITTNFPVTATPHRRSFMCPWTHDPVILKASTCHETIKPLPPPPPPNNDPQIAKEELESFISTQNAIRAPNEGLRRSLYVQQNLCTHPKLQSKLGLHMEAQEGRSPSMTMNEVLAVGEKGKREGRLKEVVKKGSRRFRVGLRERMKAGWRVRGEEWLDDDD
ncbi:MAG: hypothetical protein Q9181_005455 [Wetmoreana brouardii]